VKLVSDISMCVITIHQLTDRQTDRQTTYAIPRYARICASRGKTGTLCDCLVFRVIVFNVHRASTSQAMESVIPVSQFRTFDCPPVTL